jgi:hypothetical protein
VSKPIWSTELGLNSQGLPRHRVAVELAKKFATFFAAGGENVSWFGLLYPDPQGKSFGSSGDSHNVFDCRYNRYCPRLDAVAYYHAVNSLSDPFSATGSSSSLSIGRRTWSTRSVC